MLALPATDTHLSSKLMQSPCEPANATRPGAKLEQVVCSALQMKQSELEDLQASLASDAGKLSDQLSSFESKREAAIRELQVSSLLPSSPYYICNVGDRGPREVAAALECWSFSIATEAAALVLITKTPLPTVLPAGT